MDPETTYHHGNKRASWTRIYCVFPVMVALFSLSVLAAGPTDQELQLLTDGEILLQTIHEDKTGGAARVTALFHADTDTIWEILGYCKYKFVYLRGLKQCDLLGSGRFRNTWHHQLRNSWYAPTLDFGFEASRTYCCFGEFSLTGGELKVLEGHWQLVIQPNSEDVIVIHEIRVKPRFPVPRWLLRRSLGKYLPDMLACMRGLAKASGDGLRLEADLARCPGETPAD